MDKQKFIADGEYYLKALEFLKQQKKEARAVLRPEDYELVKAGLEQTEKKIRQEQSKWRRAGERELDSRL